MNKGEEDKVGKITPKAQRKRNVKDELKQNKENTKVGF